jgi:hypothetical protein
VYHLIVGNFGTDGVAVEDGPVPAAVPCRWDQWILPHSAGAGPTEEGISYWLTRPLRHLSTVQFRVSSM